MNAVYITTNPHSPCARDPIHPIWRTSCLPRAPSRARTASCSRTVTASGHLSTDECNDRFSMSLIAHRFAANHNARRRTFRVAIRIACGNVEVVQNTTYVDEIHGLCNRLRQLKTRRATTCPHTSCPCFRCNAFSAFSAADAAKHAHSWRPARAESRAWSRSRSA